MDHPMSDYLSTWFSLDNQAQQTTCSNFASPAAQQAFQEGLDCFASNLTKDAEKVNLSKSFGSIQEVHVLVRDSFIRYSDDKRFPKTNKWLQRIISKVHHYGNIMDVLVQHHPDNLADEIEAAQNHEATICLISKALSQIADSLPRVELVTILYPTVRVKQAVSNLYANLVRFFIRAYEWCQEGKLRHLLHSITRPPQLRYQDLLEDIAANSREIDQLAASSARVEIRDINLKLNTIVAKLESLQATQSSALLHTNQTIVAKLESFQALHSSAQLDTNQRLSDLQFSQIMSHMSEGKLGDPLEAFRFNVSLQMRQDHTRLHETTNEFWQSPKLQVWSSAPESKLAIIKGGFRARHASRKFCVKIIQQLQSKNIPVVWALRGPQNNTEGGVQII
ncbi:hypothetical protein HG530_010462 [Fusarium avenaceum]|nr:hypothetical protein HG530_010462 [Fusarium avenaceum]